MFMLGNYAKIAIRNLRQQKVYAVINVAGLAVGMSCFLIISMLVWDELSYDRFHKHADRIYRLTLDARLQEKDFRTARSSAPLVAALRAELPEVEAATHFRGGGGGGTTRNWAVRYGDKAFNERLLFFTDSSFFDVFTVEVMAGEQNAFLTQPNTIVLTDIMARKYFGEESPLGKILLLDGRLQYMVCGIVKAFPQQSHWRFDFLASAVSAPFPDTDTWISNNWNTYVLLKAGASRAHVAATLHALVAQHVRPLIQEVFGGAWEDMEARGMFYRYSFQPLTGIHLHSKLDEEIFPPGNIATVYAFIMIAVFILLTACINFMNLSTARSAHRAKEVGVRKVLGSQVSQLASLFLGEAVLLAAMAILVSLALMQLALPAVNTLAGKALSLTLLATPWVIAGLLMFTLLVGVLAGGYPAFVLSSFQPAQVLKGELRTGMRSGRLRSALVVAQFAVAITLIVGTIVVYRQLQFVRSRDLGFDQEQMLVVDNTWLLGNQTESFKELLLHQPGIVAAAFTQNLPGNDVGSGAYRREEDDHANLLMLRQLWCDPDYVATMGIKLRDGRYFSPGLSSDSTGAVLINERAAKMLGYEHPVGRNLIGFFGKQVKAMEIIGVTEDFHYEPLHLPIHPMVILVSHGAPTRIVLRVRGHLPDIVHAVQEQWALFSNGQPFTSYFLDDRLESYYRGDRTIGALIGVFACLGIFISCLGLLGLATYATEQRTKEIGIRKILGATTPNIMGLLSSEFVKLVLLANLLAWPVAYFAMQQWLQSFAYRIDQGWWVFALAGGAALLIALLTVSAQALKAARANPVESLRYE